MNIRPGFSYSDEILHTFWPYEIPTAFEIDTDWPHFAKFDIEERYMGYTLFVYEIKVKFLRRIEIA